MSTQSFAAPSLVVNYARQRDWQTSEGMPFRKVWWATLPLERRRQLPSVAEVHQWTTRRRRMEQQMHEWQNAEYHACQELKTKRDT